MEIFCGDYVLVGSKNGEKSDEDGALLSYRGGGLADTIIIVGARRVLLSG